MKKKRVMGITVFFVVSFVLGILFAFTPEDLFTQDETPSVSASSPVPAASASSLSFLEDTPVTRAEMEQLKHEKDRLRDSYRSADAVVIGTYTTDLGSHSDSNRVHNIKLALSSINNTVLLPGETFSFHGTIGDSTNGTLGYKPAAVIIGKEFATDYGGGICQVSSTLYNAVAKASLKVTERYSHSLLVDYVPKGQDATVSYPDLDFKFLNSSEHPIRVESSLQGSKVVCQILQVKTGQH